MFIHHSVRSSLFWSQLSFSNRIFLSLLTARGTAVLRSPSCKMPLLSKVTCSIPPPTRMGRSTKVGGKGSCKSVMLEEFKDTQVEEYTDFWQTSKIITLILKVWVLVMFSIVTTWPSTEQVTQNLFVFQPHEARRPWSLAPTLRHMKLVSVLGFRSGRFSDSIDFEVGQAARPCWMLNVGG